MILLFEKVRNMPEADDKIDTPARSALAVDVADVRDLIEGAETWRGHDVGKGEMEELRYVGFCLPCRLLLYDSS